MKKTVMAAIFAVGLAVVAWVGWGFAGASPLALAMTVVIGLVYGVGSLELMRFGAATASLSAALTGMVSPLTWQAVLRASMCLSKPGRCRGLLLVIF